MNCKGISLLELVVVLAIMGIIASISLPSLWKMYYNAGLDNQVMMLFAEMRTMRYDAIAKDVSMGLVFYEVQEKWYYIEVKDGNGNGIRIKDISDGIDTVTKGPCECSPDFAAEVGILSNEVPEIPPGDGYIDRARPVQFGDSGIFACSPGGSCSPGTIYFMSKKIARMQALRVFGPTSRIAWWKYEELRGWHK